MRVEFRRQFSTPGLVLEKVIPDTGADASAIPWSAVSGWRCIQATEYPV
jgi:hypothetical protein